ncbi:hypothetical protein ACOI1C_02515 [Bacillus sp. DJP31]|uniref:hypothetical protein n=1 Tax=Bacillus sp. DJP31 TaxID=3409789 RepID=UPI003BB6AB4B
MDEDKNIIEANNKISNKTKVHSESNVYDTSASRANSLINEDFYHKERSRTGISPALLLVNAPLVDTDDLYLKQNEER